MDVEKEREVDVREAAREMACISSHLPSHLLILLRSSSEEEIRFRTHIQRPVIPRAQILFAGLDHADQDRSVPSVVASP